jgi:hypothetical protein
MWKLRAAHFFGKVLNLCLTKRPHFLKGRILQCSVTYVYVCKKNCVLLGSSKKNFCVKMPSVTKTLKGLEYITRITQGCNNNDRYNGLGLRGRIPPGVWMSDSCECCMFSGRNVCQVDHSSSGVLPSVVCLSAIVKPR